MVATMRRFDSLAQWVLAPAGISYHLAPENENADYGAALVTVGDKALRVREARVTPTKPGAFVSVWRRAAEGGTEPFPAADAGDGLLVFVAEGAHEGVFCFTVEHLGELGVTRSQTSPGKRGFRVYPPWCAGLNPQASRAQRAQASAFTDLSAELPDAERTAVLNRLGLAAG
jgi:hypothetical protein